MSVKDRLQALDILKGYNGQNPYILMLKRDVLTKNIDLTDFNVEYVLKNHTFQPKQINKTIKIADWYQAKKKEDWGLDFLPEKLAVKWLLGETSTTYHCYVKYRQSVDPVQAFLPKKAVLTNFLVEDYKQLYVDFDRYDKLSMAKDINHKIKEHQKEAVRFLLTRKKCILADDMGYGKTKSLIVSSLEGNFDSIIVICPASIKSNWRDELLWYVPERDITIVEGIQGKTKNELEEYLGYPIGKSNKKVNELKEEAKERGKWQDNRFVIVNFDILDELYKIPESRSKENIEKAYQNSPILQYIKNKKSLIIIDEAHKLSNSTSIRYKIIKDLIKRGEPHSIYAATGTPITNNPYNLYCILQLLGETITDDYNYYMERYCGAFKVPAKGEKEKWTNIWRKRGCSGDLRQFIRDNAKKILVNSDATNLDELKERISHIYLRRTKEEFKGMVNKTIHEISYKLNQQQKIEYNKLWDEYEQQQFEQNYCTEINKELLEGSLYRKYLSNQMIPNTISLAENFIKNGDKVVIACCFDEELYTLKEYFGDKCVIYNGKMNSKEKDYAQNEFMSNDNIKIFIGNLQSAGVGISLIVSTKLIFNSFSYSNADNKQMEDRIHRLNQTNNVDVYYQFFEETQNEKMWNIVLKKDNIFNTVIKKEDDK